LLPRFIKDCNRLLSDGTADSVRCMGSAHISCVTQQFLHHNCSQMTEGAMVT